MKHSTLKHKLAICRMVPLTHAPSNKLAISLLVRSSPLVLSWLLLSCLAAPVVCLQTLSRVSMLLDALSWMDSSKPIWWWLPSTTLPDNLVCKLKSRSTSTKHNHTSAPANMMLLNSVHTSEVATPLNSRAAYEQPHLWIMKQPQEDCLQKKSFEIARHFSI